MGKGLQCINTRVPNGKNLVPLELYLNKRNFFSYQLQLFRNGVSGQLLGYHKLGNRQMGAGSLLCVQIYRLPSNGSAHPVKGEVC